MSITSNASTGALCTRECTRRCVGGVGLVGPSFGPFDEFHGEDEGDGECDLSESLPAEPVGVAAQLTKVREPGAGAFNGPAQSEGERFLGLCFALAFLLGADDVGEPQAVAALRGEVAVVAAVQVQGLNVQQESAVGDGLQGGFEQDGVASVRCVDDPADGDRRAGRSRLITSSRSWLGRWGWGRSLHHRTGLCAGWASTATSDGSRGDDPVVAGDGFFDELVEDPGGEPFGAPAAQGGLTCPTEPGCDVP